MIFNMRHLPWAIDIIPISVFFILIGYLYKQYPQKKHIAVMTLMGLICIISPVIIKNNTLDLYKSIIGIPFITVICSIFSIVAISNVSKILSKTFLAKGLIRIGEASITIMIFHMLVYLCLIRIVRVSFHSSMLTVIFFTVLVTILTVLLHCLFNKIRITQILFLGKKQN